MWEWLATLPVVWQIALPLSVLIVILIVALWGNAVFKWGRKSIGFGKAKKRSCTKCRQLVMIKTLKYKTDRELVRSAILRDQMNYAEVKIHEVFLGLCRSYRETIVNFREPQADIDIDREQKEYLLYQEVMNNSLTLVKNEMRRSFKENGFCEMSPVEYTQYCKEKTKAIVTISREYIMSRYPFERMIVPLQYRFDQMNIDDMETVVFNVMDRAKELVLDADLKLKTIDQLYDKELEQLGKDD